MIYSSTVLCQTPPQGISYQAIAYNSSGSIIANSNMKLRISILATETATTPIFQETHVDVQTNAQGLYNLVIGSGTVVGTTTFSSISWETGEKFIKVELDPLGLTPPNYIASGVSKLMSVPFALYSKNANNVSITNIVRTVTNLSELRGITSVSIGSDVVYVKGYATNNDGGGGHFMWDTSSILTDNDGTVIKLTSNTNNAPGRWRRVLQDEVINVKWFGVNSSGEESVSPNSNHEKINRILITHKNLYFPDGSYLISTPIELPSNTTITGNGDTSKIILNNQNAFICSGTITNKKSNIVVSKLKFEDTNNTNSNDINRFALRFKYCDNIKVEDNICKGTNLISMNLETYDNQNEFYPNSTESSLSTTIFVNNNRCYGGENLTSNLNLGAIDLSYCNKVIVNGNTVENYYSGIKWWGGDAAFQDHDGFKGRGEMNNPRWARNYTISNNIVRFVKNGGIWGSMGLNITVIGNIVENCGDVGIDAEGSFYVTVTGNSVKNCTNGCLTTFFGSKDVVFSANTVIQDGTKGNKMAEIKNVYQQGKEISVSFIGNTFNYDPISTNPLPSYGALGKFGPCESSNVLKISENSFTNVFIDIIFNNAGYRQFCNNTLFFDEQVDNVSFTAIYAGKNYNSAFLSQPGYTANLIISDNVINSKKVRTDISGIYVEQDYSSPTHTFISNNKIINFNSTAIAVKGLNNTLHRFYINNNYYTGQAHANPLNNSTGGIKNFSTTGNSTINVSGNINVQ